MPKITVFILVCLLALNPAAGAAIDTAPCPPPLCCGAAMDMGHHNGMLNFAWPMQGCCESCNDGLCDLMADPLQEVNVGNSSPFQGSQTPVFLGTVRTLGQSSRRACLSESRYPLLELRASGQLPLYLENLALII